MFSNDSEGQSIARGRVLLDSSGRFTKVIVDIGNGQPKIVFVAGGYVPSRIVTWTKRHSHFVPHGRPVASLYIRHGYSQQHITRTGKPNLLTVTLTWDDGASDIVLHVSEPGGRHIYYRDKVVPHSWITTTYGVTDLSITSLIQISKHRLKEHWKARTKLKYSILQIMEKLKAEASGGLSE